MHRPYRFPRTRICTDELLALFGMEVTRTLIYLGGGRRIPTQQHFRAALRRLDVANDWRRGYSETDLRAKYGLSRSYVRRIITKCNRELLREREHGHAHP